MPSLFDPAPDAGNSGIYDIRTHVAGPSGFLPLTEEMLRDRPSGDLFGWTMNAGMGWDPQALGGKEFLILSTHGGVRAPDGTPIALGYHTRPLGSRPAGGGSARRLEGRTAPFRSPPHCSDPCDGRTQGTTACSTACPIATTPRIVFRRLIRSLPTRSGVLGVATCDKGLPAMMMALAAVHANLPCVLVPGGVTLLPEDGEDAGRVQSDRRALRARRDHAGDAAELGCRACASPGGGCQFLGTAATSQVVGEALGMSLPHSALAPSGHAIWLDMARRSARRRPESAKRRASTMRDILTDAALRNAMVVHAAFGGSTNLILHLPAIAHRGRPAAPHRRGLGATSTARCRAWSMRCPTAPESSHRAGVPGRRRAGSHAAPAPRRACSTPTC